jgi:leader peptidase (prepilin peptidase) / N-methyltransferase
MLELIAFIEEVTPWFFPCVVFVLGACVGSFLNVCIYRMPKGVSVVWPPSQSADGRRLSWWENIPILAWLYLRGRDRVTGAPYGWRYPFVELLTGLLFVVSWLVHTPVLALVGMLFLSLLVVGTFIDLDHMILPDSITIGGMAVGVILSFWIPSMQVEAGQSLYVSDGFASGVTAMISVLVGAGLVFWVGEIGEVVFRKPAMGLGDVKLVGCIGAFCGWQGAVFSLFGGAVLGSVVLLPILLLQRLRGGSNSKGGGDGTGVEEAPTEDPEATREEIGFGLEVPFGPMLALGGVVYFLGADRWVDPYFDMLRVVVFGAPGAW